MSPPAGQELVPSDVFHVRALVELRWTRCRSISRCEPLSVRNLNWPSTTSASFGTAETLYFRYGRRGLLLPSVPAYSQLAAEPQKLVFALEPPTR